MNAILVFVIRLFFIVLSYLFIGWIVYSIYLDLRGSRMGQRGMRIPAITLKTEIDQEELSKRFTRLEITLGRDPACEFPIADETISLRHGKLAYHHKQWWFEDLDSTNGSFVNETMVEEPVVVTGGDQLRLGRISLSININSAANGE